MKPLNFRFLITLISLTFFGFLALLLTQAYNPSTVNPELAQKEFVPVMILGFCYLVLAFTTGEFFGLIRYQFYAQDSTSNPPLPSTQQIAYRALGVFFVLMICFYYMRAGFSETVIEKVFFTSAPVLLISILFWLTNLVYRSHMMPFWYYRLKQLVLFLALLGSLFANMSLFFREDLVNVL